MKARINELRRAMFDLDFKLIVNKKQFSNSDGRKFLFEIENQNLEVDFYIGNAGFFVIETEIRK